MQERHLEPETAKTRTEEKKLAELGDGEPSPPFILTAFVVLNSGFVQSVFSSRAEAERYAAKMCKGSPEVEIRQVELVERSGAAQQVSPSPEPVCPMCCKPVFTDGYEGDTRELKAALRLAKTRLEICLGRFAGCEDGKYSKTTVTYGDKVEKRHEVSLAEIPAWIEEMNSLLG